MVAVQSQPHREVELVAERAIPDTETKCTYLKASAADLIEPHTPTWSVENRVELTAGQDQNNLSTACHSRKSASSVRQRAQYFEALIRSNTDTIVRSFSEVQLMLRVPNHHLVSSDGGTRVHPKYGNQDEMAALIERLQSQLEVKEREKQLTASALGRKAQECDNLMRVVRELADSRAKVVSTKVSLQEKYAELQAEFHRMMRIADLSRTVSKENLAKTSRTQKALRQTETELHSSRSQAAKLQNKSKKLKVENCQLKEKLSLLERLEPFEGVQESMLLVDK